MSKTKRFLSKAEVRDKVKLGHSEIARREKKGTFPKRLRLGNYPTSRAVWLEDDIDAWMDAQIAKRDAAPKLIEEKPKLLALPPPQRPSDSPVLPKPKTR